LEEWLLYILMFDHKLFNPIKRRLLWTCY
jgi:hypothetical protein